VSSEDLASVFDARATQAADRLAVRESDRDWSYGELLDRSRQLSNALESLGSGPGSRVALQLPNSAAFVGGFFGIARVGSVIAPLSVRYRTQELEFYLEDSRATALVTHPEGVQHARGALARIEQPPALIELGADGEPRILAPGRAECKAAALGASRPLLQQYTSGSTGTPKRVVRSHSNLMVELATLARTFDLGPEDRFLGVAPFSHVNGLVRSMLTSMFVGGRLYPVPTFRRRQVLELITRERISYFGGVPHMFVILAETPPRAEFDLGSLRVVFSASAPLLPDDNRAFHARYGSYVRQLYGSSETGTISVNLDSDVASCLESVGRPLDGVRIEILDDEGRGLPAGAEGEVAIASPASIRAYDANPEATRKSFRDGLYLSGDLGRRDEQGRLTLTGRKKFLINRGGFKVNPLEVETAIQSHPKVREVVVLGAPGRHGDDLVRCVIVAGEGCTETEIVEHCAGQIADYKIPSRIEFRQELPKSDAGKTLRGEL
jgi:long-chain acyl-CoA synthetase